MARDRDRVYETEDGIRIAALSALDDFEVAEGYPDIRGWRVDSADGREVGKVHDLLIDVDNMRTRYLDVRLTKELAATPGDRDVLIPIGTAQVMDANDIVRVPLTAERIGLLPLYDHGGLTRTHELEVRRHFSLGEAAAAAATGAAAGAATRDFYDDDGYDDRRFFGKRRTVRTDADVAARRVDSERELAARERTDRDVIERERADRDILERERAERELADRDRMDRAVADRDLRTRDDEIRVPVDRDDAVVLKRGEDGRDEIIIRRPRGAGEDLRRP